MAGVGRGLRLYGIPLAIHPSWALVCALIVFALGSGRLPGTGPAPRPALYLVGTAVAAFLFGSVLLHELAHALVARRCALSVRRIVIYPFGGAVELDADALQPRSEALVAGAGPPANAALAALFGALWWALRGTGEVLEQGLQLLALVNGAIVLLTVLPAYPLDGGRIVRALIWYVTDDLLAATRVATLYGQLLGWSLLVGGVVLFLRDLPAWGAGLVLCGWFLRAEARRGYRQALWQDLGKRIPAAHAAFLRPPRIPLERTLDEAVDDVLEGLGAGNEGGPSVVVDAAGVVIGVLGLDQLRRFKRAQWSRTTAAEAMLPRAGVPAIPQEMTLAAALAVLSENRSDYGLIVAVPAGDGNDPPPIGVITPTRIVRYLLREGRRTR